MNTNLLQKNIPKGWGIKKIKDLLDFEQPTKYIVENSNYIPNGKTPVLTANKSFVLGYTNETEGVYTNTPSIIFDDFTTDSKFVDFPFKVKSSAIKILKNKEGVGLYFIYEKMKSISFPIANHKRHYISQYQDMEVLVPPYQEQKKIAEILSSVDEEIQKVEEIISKTEELKKGLMQRLFTKGIGHKKFKKTKIGEIPEEWEVLSIQDLIDKNYLENNQDGNHGSQHPKSSDFISNGIPFITAADLKGNKLDLTNGHFLSKELADKLRIGFSYNNDVLITHKGSVGATAIIENLKTEYAMLSPQVTYYRCKKGLLNKFLFYIFQANYFQANLKTASKQSTRDFLSITNQRKLKIIFCPDIKEQTKIVEILESVDREINITKSLKTNYLQLKQGLMSDLLSGRVRTI